MPIDPSISLQYNVKPLEVPDPLQYAGRMLQLRNLVQVGRENELQNQERMRKMQQQDRVQAHYGRGMTDRKKFLEELYTIDPHTAAAQEKHFADQDKAAEELKAKLEAAQRDDISRLGYAVLNTPEDQRDRIWGEASQRLIQTGRHKAEDIPAARPDEHTLRLMVFGSLPPEKQAQLIQSAADEERKKADEIRKQGEYDATIEGKRAESRGKVMTTAGQGLAAVTDQATYDRWLSALPADIQATLPRFYSPAAVTIGEKQAMTAKQRADLAASASVAAQNAQHQTNMENIAKRGQDMRAQRGGGGAGGNGSPSDLAEAVIANPSLWDTITPSARTKIAPELAKRGFGSFGKPLSESALKNIAEADSTLGHIKALQQTLQADPDSTFPGRGLIAKLPWTEANKLQARIDLLRQRVGKMLEGGVLRKEDEDKYRKILPTIDDAPETAVSKLNDLIVTIERDRDTYKNQQRLGGRQVNEPPQTPKAPVTGAPRTSTTTNDGRRALGSFGH